MKYDNKEDIIKMTPLWKGERFENGRPKVSEDIMNRLEKIALEEAWGVLWNSGYKYQFQGDWKVIPEGKTLVGRAVTGVMVPMRPDLHETLLEYGQKEEGRGGFFNSWVIEILEKDDVMVIDMFDKIKDGTYSGGNLSNTVSARGGRGQVLWSGIRDVQQVMDVEGLVTFYRGNDPTGIADVTMTGINVPCRIGQAICMPGDIVMGSVAGVLFVPPHLAEECCITGERTQLREMFQFQRIHEGTYNSHQMDTEWSKEIEADFHNWRKDNTPEGYKSLKWDKESMGEQQISDTGTVL